MSHQPDFVWTVLKMLVSLGILLVILMAGLYAAKRIFRKADMGTGGKMVRVLANTYVGVKKTISLVEVPGAVLVIGITSDKISLLTKIEDRETLDMLAGPGHEKANGSFMDHLQRFSVKKRGRWPSIQAGQGSDND